MPEFTGATDEKHTFTLPSEIDSVHWDRRQAAPGGKVGLDVRTLFCGDGSQIQIKLTDAQGTVHNTLSGTLRDNRVNVDLRVPKQAKGGLIAQVKLPNHGLSAESWALKVLEPVRVRNPKWPSSTARRGDVLTLSADVRGAPDGRQARVRIFEHDNDGAHDPVTWLTPRVEGGAIETKWQFQYQRDTDDIPPEADAPNGYTAPEFFFRVEVGGLTADSGLLTFEDDARIHAVDLASGGAVAEETVTVRLPDGSETQKTLNTDGDVQLQNVPPGQLRYYLPDIPGSSENDPLRGATGPRANEATLWRLAPRQTVMTVNHKTGVLDTHTAPLAKGTWVYVFPEHPGEDPPMTPVIEAKATGEGTLKRVDWSTPSKWKGKDKRSPSIDAETKNDHPYLRFLATEDCEKVHVMLSPCQITYKRLAAYRHNEDPHAEDLPLTPLRCETLDADALETIRGGGTHEIGYFTAEQAGGLLQVSVVQPIQLARAAGSAYRHAVERLKTFQNLFCERR